MIVGIQDCVLKKSMQIAVVCLPYLWEEFWREINWWPNFCKLCKKDTDIVDYAIAFDCKRKIEGEMEGECVRCNGAVSFENCRWLVDENLHRVSCCFTKGRCLMVNYNIFHWRQNRDCIPVRRSSGTQLKMSSSRSEWR